MGLFRTKKRTKSMKSNSLNMVRIRTIKILDRVKGGDFYEVP